MSCALNVRLTVPLILGSTITRGLGWTVNDTVAEENSVHRALLAGMLSHIGQLDKGLDEAQAKGWTVVSTKDDWKRIFAFEP